MKLDKFYTSNLLAKQLIELTFMTLSACTISEIIEPAAGAGAFSSQIEKCIAYDIEPDTENIIKADFLKLDIQYKKCRLIIGNPPFGKRGILYRQFFIKSSKIGDYIAFILPISQLNNNETFSKKWDLIKSVDLNIQEYSGIKLHCCFNIYRRPLVEKINCDLIKMYDPRYKNYENIEYDFKIVRYGENSGKEATNQYCIYKIYVNDRNRIEEIKNLILNHNFFENKKFITSKVISIYEIKNLINNYEKKKIKENRKVILKMNNNKTFNDFIYDFKIIKWGTRIGADGSNSSDSCVLKVFVKNRNEIENIKNYLFNYDFVKDKKFCSMPYLKFNDIYKALEEYDKNKFI